MKYLSTVIVFLCMLAACSDIEIDPIKRVTTEKIMIIKDQIFSTVAIVTANSFSQYCSGTLIAPKLILTAAHCVSPSFYNSLYAAPEDIIVIAGVLNIENSVTKHIYEVTEIILHPKFLKNGAHPLTSTPSKWDDLALLFLKRKVNLPSTRILSKEIAKKFLKKGTLLIISGYGRTDIKRPDGILHNGRTPYNYRASHEFRTGGKGFISPCYGDSGGPAYLFDLKGNRWLVGLSSRVIIGDVGICGQGGIHTLVPMYESWIVKNSKGQY